MSSVLAKQADGMMVKELQPAENVMVNVETLRNVMSRTDNTRPWQIREADDADVWRHLKYCKQAKIASSKRNDCPWCTNLVKRKSGSKRGAIKDQLDNPA